MSKQLNPQFDPLSSVQGLTVFLYENDPDSFKKVAEAVAFYSKFFIDHETKKK